jgi:hypothetical protein
LKTEKGKLKSFRAWPPLRLLARADAGPADFPFSVFHFPFSMPERCSAQAGWAVASLAFCILLSGCAANMPCDLPIGASYHPANTFVLSSTLPPTIKRVAVLPLVSDDQCEDLTAGREALEPVLLAELAKTRRFEITRPSADCLRVSTGRNSWSGEEPLPANFFASLREALGCDAVLFCRLTVFRGYAPLAIGWRMRLVDARTRDTLWAADEVFDAGQPAVRAGARRYQIAELRTPAGCPEEWIIRNSPRQFGQYAAARLLATLPNP